MAAYRRSYFLVPNFNFPPDGPIALGNIISDACFPAETLLAPAPEAPDNSPGEPKIHSLKERGWQNIRTAHTEGRMGVWARFIGIVDIDLEGRSRKDISADYTCAEMETQYILPDINYLKARAADRNVEQVMKMRRGGIGYRRAVYMVTGVKIAKDLELSTGSGQERRFDVDASVDITSLSGGTASVGVGAGAGRTTGSQEQTNSRVVGDCVFAYQLSRLRYTGAGNKKELDTGPHRKGAFFNTDDDEDVGERNIGDLEFLDDFGSLEMLKLEEEIDDEWEAEAKDAVEGQESYRCIFLKQRSE